MIIRYCINLSNLSKKNKKTVTLIYTTTYFFKMLIMIIYKGLRYA